jgi:3-keto-L-gulonate-6-phosphate decarboxylase
VVPSQIGRPIIRFVEWKEKQIDQFNNVSAKQDNEKQTPKPAFLIYHAKQDQKGQTNNKWEGEKLNTLNMKRPL